LAQALNVSVEELLGSNGKRKRGFGPTGKMKQLFEPPLNSRVGLLVNKETNFSDNFFELKPPTYEKSHQ